MKDHAFASHTSARHKRVHLSLDVIEKVVIVCGVVMEGHKGTHTRCFGKADAFLPSRMPPPRKAGVLFISVGAIVDKDICALDQVEDILIERADLVFGIGDVADGATA